jgi:hypothetical protein
MKPKVASLAILMIAGTTCGATPILEPARPLDALLSDDLETRSLNMMGLSVGARS